MAERARKIGVEDLSARLPVANPRDELGRLAETFNDLLSRLEASLDAAAAVHGRCVARAAHAGRDRTHRRRGRAAAAASRRAGVSRNPRHHRAADDAALAHRRGHVHARAGGRGKLSGPRDADVSRRGRRRRVSAARVLASTKEVSIELATTRSAAFTGDEDLIRRLIGNLLDNAVRHAPPGSTVASSSSRHRRLRALGQRRRAGHSAGDPAAHLRAFLSEATPARTSADGGAGLGLALARWIATAHGGDVTLARSSSKGTTFTAILRSAS